MHASKFDSNLASRLLLESDADSHIAYTPYPPRRQEKIFFSVKDYEKAEQYRQAADGMEAEERMGGEQLLQEELLKQERNLRKRQQMALATLLKRIQRDREEQLKHRFEDA